MATATAILPMLKANLGRPATVQTKPVDSGSDCESPKHHYANDLLELYKTHVAGLEHLIGDYKTEKKQCKTLTNDLNKAKTDLNTANASLKTERENLKAEQAKLKETNGLLATAQHDRDTARNQLAKIQSDLEATKKKLVTMTTEKEKFEGMWKKTDAELTETKTALTKTSDELKSTKDTLHSTTDELNRTKELLKATEGTLQKTEADLTTEKANGKKLQNRIEEMRQSLEEYKVQLANANKGEDDAKANLEAANAKLETANAEVRAANQKERAADKSRDEAFAKLQKYKETHTQELMPGEVPQSQQAIDAFFKHRPRERDGWYIDEIIYGGKRIDDEKVYQEILSHAVKGTKFTVNNQLMGGDPWPGNIKTFTIVYCRNRKAPFCTLSGKEYETYGFPA